jgi:beta-aspartyl-peptidase (threonine type)
MIRWNWWTRVCVVAVLLSALGELRADEAAAAKASKPDAAVRGAIEGVLRAQQEAWNGGDVRAFMEHYWKSDDLTFSSGGKTTRGWQATLDGYLKRYPTREKMGRLTLSGLEITPLSDAAAMVLGQWKLDGLKASFPRTRESRKEDASTLDPRLRGDDMEAENELVGGNFTLVFRKIEGRWVIVHDHTSRLVE